MEGAMVRKLMFVFVLLVAAVAIVATTGCDKKCELCPTSPTAPTTPAACTYTVSPTSQNFAHTGGSGNVAVGANRNDCTWTATSNASWVTVTGGSSGSGNGSVSYTVAANTGPARTGVMMVAGQAVTITQDAAPPAACTYTVSPTSQNFAHTGGSGNVAVGANRNDCTWTATSNASWVTVTGGSSGSGNGSVSYTVAANTGPARTGVMMVAGQAVTITQDAAPPAACTYTVSPTSQNFAHTGGSGNVAVGANRNDCTWTATSNASWVTVTGGSSGSGNGSVSYTVA